MRCKRIDLVTNCIRGLEQRDFYANREYVVVHAGNWPESQLRELQANARVVLGRNDVKAFNFSQTLNVGVAPGVPLFAPKTDASLPARIGKDLAPAEAQVGLIFLNAD